MSFKSRDLPPRQPKPAGSSQRPVALVCLASILILAVALRYRAADHPYISQWDEAYHALVARNLMTHPLVPTLHEQPVRDVDLRSWTANHIWLHKPPMALWLMAGAMAIGGESALVFRLPSVLLGTVAVLLTFLIGRTLFGVLAGLVAAGLHALNPLLIRLVSGTVPTDQVDATLVFFVELTWWLLLVASTTGRQLPRVLAGLALGAAFLAKSMPAGIALTGVLVLAKGDTLSLQVRSLLRAVVPVGLAAATVVLPWKLYTVMTWPEEFAVESQIVLEHLSSTIEEHAHSASWYVELIPVHYGGMPEQAITQVATFLVILGSIGLAIVQLWTRRNPRLLAIVLWAIGPYLVFSLVGTKLYAYVATAVPAVVLLVGHATSMCWRFARSARFTAHDPSAKAVLVIVAAITGAHLLTLAADRITADYSVPPWNRLYDTHTFRIEMIELGRREGRKVLFNVGDHKTAQAMFYSGAEAYPDPPSPAEITKLTTVGYQLYLVTDYRRRHQRQIDLLATAGLLDEVTLIEIPRPEQRSLESPYLR